jgi:23S rRNA pseudouridine2605 synthase
VRVHGAVDERALAALARGVTVEGVAYGPIEAGLDSRQGANAWLTISLKEGKNREVRRVMAHLGLQVTRLIRVAYGPFQLGALPRGGVEEVHPRILRDQLGIGEKPVRRRGGDTPTEAPPDAPEPPPQAPRPPGSRSIPRARNAAPRRPHANRRRPSPRS